MRYVALMSSDLRGGFADAWAETVETGKPLVVTSSGRFEFAIFPVTNFVPQIYGHIILRIARATYYLATGREEVPQGYEDDLPETSPDAMRKSFGVQRRLMRSMGTPFAMTYFRQLAGILFPIPHDGGEETVDKLIEAWNETLETVLG